MRVAARRIILSVALLTFVAGCSGYRTAVIPGHVFPETPNESDSPIASACHIVGGTIGSLALVAGLFFVAFVISYTNSGGTGN